MDDLWKRGKKGRGGKTYICGYDGGECEEKGEISQEREIGEGIHF